MHWPQLKNTNYPSANVLTTPSTTSPQRQLEKEAEEEGYGGGRGGKFSINRARGFLSEGCVQCVSAIHKRTRTRTCTRTEAYAEREGGTGGGREEGRERATRAHTRTRLIPVALNDGVILLQNPPCTHLHEVIFVPSLRILPSFDTAFPPMYCTPLKVVPSGADFSIAPSVPKTIRNWS
jgi:hypothetical protein